MATKVSSLSARRALEALGANIKTARVTRKGLRRTHRCV